MITLMLTPRRPDRFDAHLEGNLIVTSHRPLYDGARALQKLGHSDDDLLTTRHVGSAHDNFMPMPIGYWARWSTTESGNTLLKRCKWVPNPLFASAVLGRAT